MFLVKARVTLRESGRERESERERERERAPVVVVVTNSLSYTHTHSLSRSLGRYLGMLRRPAADTKASDPSRVVPLPHRGLRRGFHPHPEIRVKCLIIGNDLYQGTTWAQTTEASDPSSAVTLIPKPHASLIPNPQTLLKPF